jgi:hypothetical protein
MALTIRALVLMSLGLVLPGAGFAAGIERLAWLAGCWTAEGGEPGSVEQWMAPAGGQMLGMARTLKNGRVRESEFMRIAEGPDGRLQYTALPSGQREASFTQATLAEAEVVFENLQHDFPQRVIYRRQGGDGLLARIEGQRQGALRGIDFPMRRVPCAP